MIKEWVLPSGILLSKDLSQLTFSTYSSLGLKSIDFRLRTVVSKASPVLLVLRYFPSGSSGMRLGLFFITLLDLLLSIKI